MMYVVFLLQRTPAFSSSPSLLCSFCFFVCSGSLFCLQWFPFLFAVHQSFLFEAVSFFVCSVRFLFAAHLFCLQRSFFVCSAPFLLAAFIFCLQRILFVCSVRLLFATNLFCLQRIFFVCSVRFLFAANLFCLQRTFFVCSVPLVGHRMYVSLYNKLSSANVLIGSQL